MPELYKRNPNTRCSVCNKEIYKRPSELEQSKGKAYCSSACYGIACRKEKPCLVCGTSILASFHKKTCSRSCANTHRAGIRYKINRPKDKVKAQQAVRTKLIRVRGQKCERCSYSSVHNILQVHHKSRDRTDNSLDNLELLCPNCHAFEHYMTGKGRRFFEKRS